MKRRFSFKTSRAVQLLHDHMSRNFIITYFHYAKELGSSVLVNCVCSVLAGSSQKKLNSSHTLVRESGTCKKYKNLNNLKILEYVPVTSKTCLAHTIGVYQMLNP